MHKKTKENHARIVFYIPVYAILNKFLVGLYYGILAKLSFLNYYTNELIKWVIFGAVQYTCSTCFIGPIMY